MKWIGCCVLGLIVGFALGRLLPASDEGTAPPSALDAPVDDEATTDGPSLDVREDRGAEAPALIDAPPVDENGLAVGQGLILATGMVVTGERLAEADLVVADIRERSVWVKTPRGSAGGALPLGAINLPRTAAGLAATFEHAPTKLPDRSRSLEFGAVATGIAFVRDGTDQVHLVWIEGLAQHEAVLRRRVRLASRPINAVDGGGVASIPTAVETEIEGVSTRTLEAISKRGSAVPRTMNGSIGRLMQTPKLVQNTKNLSTLDDRSAPLVVADRIDRTLKVATHTVVVAAGGDSPDAKVDTEFHGVLVILGDLEGTHNLKAHAHVHVTGDVLGQVSMEHHATLVVEGDVRGTVRPGTWTKLVLHGTVRGRIEVGEGRNSTWPVFILDRYVSKGEMANLPRAGDSPRLYVRESDLDVGEHRGVHGWSEVHVGGDFWKMVGR